MKSTLIGIVWLLAAGVLWAQEKPGKPLTAEEIIAKYHENSGGKARWDSLTSVVMRGRVTVQGMEIPTTLIQTAQGQQKVTIRFQGQETTQQAFDGQEGWSSNFMTQRPEKMTDEANAIARQQASDFPDALLNYQARGYSAELGEPEAIEGKQALKIKLTKPRLRVDDELQDNITYYFFDPETFLPVATRSVALSGQAKGASVETLLSDYRDVQGLLFPFHSQTSYNGQPGETLQIEDIELNRSIDPQLFAFPEK